MPVEPSPQKTSPEPLLSLFSRFLFVFHNSATYSELETIFDSGMPDERAAIRQAGRPSLDHPARSPLAAYTPHCHSPAY